MKRIFSIVIVCALFGACEKTAEPDLTLVEDKYSCELPATYVNGKEAWVPGDQLVIHGEYSKDQKIITLTPSDISEDGKTCIVDVAGVTPYEQKAVKSKYYLAYPAEFVNNPKQPKDQNTFNSTNAMLITGYNKGKTFVLEPLVGGLKFTVSGDFDSYEIHGNNDETIGYSSLTCRVNTNTSIYAQSKGTAKAIVTGKVVADGKTANHICFPEQPILADGFLLVFYKNGAAIKSY